MGLWKKIKHSVRRHTTGSRFGFKKASVLNPLTHGLWTVKKIHRGLRKGTWKANIAKYLTGQSRSASSSVARSNVVPSGYVHSAKSISELMK
jgi:hypothetical protein